MEGNSRSAMVISLDFELHWGVADQVRGPENSYWKRLQGAREAIPHILEMFEKRCIHATWATVGFIFAHGREDMNFFNPQILPQYLCNSVNNYLIEVGESEREDPVHFAPSLIKEIMDTSGQELASHTYSHYYCDDPGQDMMSFRADLEAAQAIADRDGVRLRTLVFPRNQVKDNYLDILPETGIEVYRGNPISRLYQVSEQKFNKYTYRALRLLDSYFNLTGHHTVKWSDIRAKKPYNVRYSHFFRPYSRKLRALDFLRLNRVKKGLREAARCGEVYHLWWHPHNFGVNLAENLVALESILDEFSRLWKTHGMRSMTMAEAADSACQD